MRSLVFLPLVAVASASINVPLVRRARSFTSESLAAQRDSLDSKYNRHGSNGRVKPRQATSTGVPLVNQQADSSYLAIMGLGTPVASYGVVLDTGSSDLWFQSSACVGCTKGVKTSTTSTTQKQSGQPFEITYGSGSVTGQIVSDVVTMGGYTIQDRVMGMVNQTTGVLLTGQAAGLLGLAFKILSNTQSTPFWEALVEGGRWSEPLMSFWMTRYTNVTNVQQEEFGGEFRMGGTNTTLYTGAIEYHSLPETVNSYWMIPLREISVNGGQPMIITNLGVTSLAAIDTGTTLIGGPPSIVAEIYAQIPGAQRATGNLDRYWVYPCSQSVSMTFNFEGRAWPMTPEDFQLSTNDPTWCVGSVFEVSLGGLGNPDAPQWIVGDAFLKNVYSVFRYEPPSIGFAQLSAYAASGGMGQAPPVVSSSSPTASSSSTSVTGNPTTGRPATSAPSMIPATPNGAIRESWNIVGTLAGSLIGLSVIL